MAETAQQRQDRDVEAQSTERKTRNFFALTQERAEREYKTDSTTLWTYVDANN
jgi:hypothetical protein